MSGIQGFPSNQKVPLGTGITNNFVTVIPTDPNRAALDTPRFAFRVDDALVPRTAGAGTGIGKNSSGEDVFFVEDTATPARVGDFVRFENGPAAFLEIPIVAVETNKFMLAVKSGSLPVSGNTFYIMRYATQRVDDSGSQLVIASPGPSQFVLDGLDVEVERDTTTPANSKPFPVINLDNLGVPVDFATETTLALIDASLNTLKAGASYQNSIRLDYSGTNVDNANWTELIASVGATEIKEITLFDGGGFAMELGIGAASSEVRALLIPPGGFNGKFKLTIPAGSRLSIRAIGSALVNAGEIDINLFV